MSGFDQRIHDIRQGYNVIDLLPEEDGVLFNRLATDVKQGYCVLDLLEEEELGGGVGCQEEARRHLGSFSSVQSHPQEVTTGAQTHLGSFSSVLSLARQKVTCEVTSLLHEGGA